MSRIPILTFAITTLLIPTTHAFSLSEWLSKDPYSDGGAVREQIQCYALPYGAIGMASHILRPGSRTSAADVHLGDYYPLKAPMRMGSAVMLNRWDGDDSDDEEWHRYHLPGLKGGYHRVWYWVPLYMLGVVVGFVGIMNIVLKHIMGIQQLRIITGVFGGVVLLIVLVVVMLLWLMMSESGGCIEIVGISCLAATGVAVFALSVLFAFYTDWVLAALAEDLVGTPSQDNAVFYWTYFAAKRLPMVSF
ncbi:hypothetical protein QBC36DRAFT_358822 [Triangularia setosa]|uniref:Uncharacterized protein n=1 Tax=Triangularia setosa TaxID=2587417 RepID=A0AAN7A3D8_9PEZI|nr:hypothetical protein QBC36DRAFT_358822 [Podospora setosa]